MAIELASGYVSVSPNAKGFGTKLQAEIGPDLDRAGVDAGDRVSKGFGAKLATGLAAAFATAKIGQGLSGAIGSATDMSETISKVGVIFGDSSGAVEAFAATADRSFGQSRQQALDAAATFAVFGKSAGLSGDQLAGFSTGLVGLSSDFASFFNTSPDEAIEAIGAALRGESEPIRKYGVLLDDATLRARALKLGLIATTKDALTPQQKVLAAQAEILAQAGDAQGDFARTSEGAANKQRILSAQMANANAELGSALMPAYAALVSILADKVVPAITKVTTYLSEHKGVAIAVGVAIAGLLVVAFLAWAASAIAAAAATLAAIAPILLIAAAVVGFIALMIVLPTIVGENIGKIVDFFINAGKAIGEFFLRLPGMILSFLAGAASWLVDAGKAIIQGLIDGITAVVPVVVEFFTSLPGKILDWVKALAVSLLFDHGRNTIQGVLDGAANIIGAVANFFSSIPGWVLDWVRSLAASLLFGHGQQTIQGLLSGAASLIGSVASFFASIPGQILGWIGNLGGLLVGVGASVIQGFINGMNSWIGSIAGTVSNIPSIVRNALGNLGGILFAAGQAVVQGLINGIGSMVGAAASAAANLARSARDAAFRALGIGSPSKVFAEIGVNVGEGFILGLEKTGGMVAGAVSDVFGVGPQRFSTTPTAATMSAAQASVTGVAGSPTIVINAPLGVDRREVVAAVQQGLRQHESARRGTR